MHTRGISLRCEACFSLALFPPSNLHHPSKRCLDRLSPWFYRRGTWRFKRGDRQFKIPQLLTDAARIQIYLNSQANRIISFPVLARRIALSHPSQRLLVSSTRVPGGTSEALPWRLACSREMSRSPPPVSQAEGAARPPGGSAELRAAAALEQESEQEPERSRAGARE